MRNITELHPVYDSRKSFYGKAFIKENDNVKSLFSYGMEVMKIVTIENQKALFIDPAFNNSQTTLRHSKEFLKQNGYSVTNLDSIKKLAKLDNVQFTNL